MGMRERWTYLIQPERGGPVKIGIATSPADRLRSLQTGSPYLLKIVAMFKGEQHEWSLHKKYAALRLHGEWFEECVAAHIRDFPPDTIYVYKNEEKSPPPDPPAEQFDDRCVGCDSAIAGEHGVCLWCESYLEATAA